MIQVSTNTSGGFTVLVDGSPHGQYATRTQAILAAIELREQQDPIKIGGA